MDSSDMRPYILGISVDWRAWACRGLARTEAIVARGDVCRAGEGLGSAVLPIGGDTGSAVFAARRRVAPPSTDVVLVRGDDTLRSLPRSGGVRGVTDGERGAAGRGCEVEGTMVELTDRPIDDTTRDLGDETGDRVTGAGDARPPASELLLDNDGDSDLRAVGEVARIAACT
jgi:hypothetical protein